MEMARNPPMEPGALSPVGLGGVVPLGGRSPGVERRSSGEGLESQCCLAKWRLEEVEEVE